MEERTGPSEQMTRIEWLENQILSHGCPFCYPSHLFCSISRMFDKLREEGRLEFTAQVRPFAYPVFVVWKMLSNGKRKGRPVIDLRALDELILRDAYAPPPQSEVVGMLAGCGFISVLDATSFFYQWRLHPDCRYMMTVVSHRGQESLNIPIMGCVNSIAYVQRQIDRILRRLERARAKAYVDDIVTGSETFELTWQTSENYPTCSNSSMSLSALLRHIYGTQASTSSNSDAS